MRLDLAALIGSKTNMLDGNPPLPFGYSPLPTTALANVVTCLEMHAPPPITSARALQTPLQLARFGKDDLHAYRNIFKAVGEDWMWVSRLVMPDAELTAILADDRVEAYAVMDDGKPVGLLELDFREQHTCELAFFGLVQEAIGQGAGRWLMNQAIDRAWAAPIQRFWVHTCSFDHPSAVLFYQRSGFRPYARFVEVLEDPRRTGQMRTDAAPHVPLITG